MEFTQDMYPYLPTWSNTRINLLQRCPRAFVLRYGLAKLTAHHPQGKMLGQAFAIQSPWIIMHQVVRHLVLDYIEDYVNGTIWSPDLIRIRFKQDYRKAIQARNQQIEQFQQNDVDQAIFQPAQPEHHLIEMGVNSCINFVQNPNLRTLLANGSIERLEPTNSIVMQKVRLYCSPDFVHHGTSGKTLIKLHLYGNLSRLERIHQASLLQHYGDHDSTVMQFSLAQRKWYVHKSKPNGIQRKQAMDMVHEDVMIMHNTFASVKKNNDLTKIPLADSYRACMNCNVRFICPAKDGYEQAKAEQRVLMCQ